MIKNKPSLNHKERVIIQYIDSEGGNISAHELSEKTGISYVTVQKYCEILLKDEILIAKKEEETKDQKGRSNTTKYFINYTNILDLEPSTRKRKKRNL